MKDLDFSVFHDLMHRVGSKECRSQPGGALRHAGLWWVHIGWPHVLRPVYWVACRFGRHRVMHAFRVSTGETWLECNYCPWRQDSLWDRQQRLTRGES